MQRADVGQSADLLKSLEEYRLLTPEDLRKVEAIRSISPEHDGGDFLGFLVGQGLFTTFQANAIKKGNAASLVLSRFILTETLGNGSLGTVYKARAADGPGLYALRIVPRRNVMTLNEAAEKVKALREIRHPRVSALVHLGASGERVYMAWPFLEGGETLEALVCRQARLPPRQTVQIGLQVASGLQPYHEHGLFHGLLKPSDILIGTDRRVRILDFGVGFLLSSERGKSLLDTMTNTKALARGLDCSSPESLMNPLDRTPQGDQYSLGCVLYFCLTGQYPFPTDNPVKKMLAHQCEEPQPLRELNSEVSPRLSEIVHRLMRKTPQERYPDMAHAVQALQALSHPAPRRPEAPPTTASPAAPSATPEATQEAASSSQQGLSKLIGLGLLAGGAAAGCALGWFLARR
jgi:serine/threonine-protein kinase